MSPPLNKHFLASIVVSNIFLFLFIGLAVNVWLQNRSTKAEADYHYQQMLATTAQCNQSNMQNDRQCQNMVEHRKKLDKLIYASAQYDSKTRVFIAFAVFIPLLTWGGYFLTRAIFH